MTDLQCDVAVIGAGTAGRAAERSARRNGASTLLVDETFSGTTCVRTGCMPSKLLLAAGEAARGVRRAALFGVEARIERIDGRAVMQRVRALRDGFLAHDRETIEALPAGVAVRARARFADANTLVLDDGRRVRARAVVIATGASASVPEAFRSVSDRVLTNDTVFELPDLPLSLAVVGAGPLGLELAQAFAHLGVRVAVFDRGDAVAGLADRRAERELRRILEADFPIRTAVDLEAESGDAGVRLRWQGESAGEEAFERVLAAAGRPPRLDGLGLDGAGLALDGHGTPVCSRDTLQCGDAPVFVAGDADHDRPVLHEASDEGTIAGRNAALFPDVRPAERCAPFSVMFTEPTVAVIGAVPDRGAENDAVVVGEASYADQGRARVMGRNGGLARLYAERRTGRLTGATLAAPGAEHMAHLLVWAVQDGRTARDLLDVPFYHPTLEEGLKPALRRICEAAGTDAPSRDEARPPAV